jgi:hypothetical protein
MQNIQLTAPPLLSGYEVLDEPLFLGVGGNDSGWVDSSLEITLPQAGTYLIWGQVRGRFAYDGDVTVSIRARLLNVGDSSVAAVARVVGNNISVPPSNDQFGSVNHSAPLNARVVVAGPTTYRLQGRYTATGVGGVGPVIDSDAEHGLTSLMWLKVE